MMEKGGEIWSLTLMKEHSIACKGVILPAQHLAKFSISDTSQYIQVLSETLKSSSLRRKRVSTSGDIMVYAHLANSKIYIVLQYTKWTSQCI